MDRKIGERLYTRLKEHSRKQDRLIVSSLLLITLALLVITSVVAFLTFCAWFYLFMITPAVMALAYFFRRPGLYKLARDIEKEDSSWQDRLSTAVDLSGKDNPREIYSPELTTDYVEGIENRVTKSQLSIRKAKSLVLGSLLISAASVVVGFVLTVLFLDRVLFGALALFAPHSLDLSMKPLVSDTLVNPGEHIAVSALVTAPIKLRYVYADRNIRGKRDRIKVGIANDTASIKINVNEEQRIRFTRLGCNSDEIYIGLLQPFEITKLETTVFAPSYTGEKPKTSLGLRILGLPGSKVNIKGIASAELSKGYLRVGDSAVSLEVTGRDFNGNFELEADKDITLVLANRVGARLEQRIEVEIRPDEVPLVEVFMPGEDTEVNSSMVLTLGVFVLDDYGLGQVQLVSTGTNTGNVAIARSRGRLEDTIFYRWDISQLDLLPGDEITYYIQASDNDVVGGPKWGRSKTFRLRFPDISEMFSEVTDYGERTTEGLTKLSEKQEDLSAELSRIEEKLRSEQALSPEETERLRELVNQQENLLSSVDSLAKETREFLKKLEEGMISDPATLEKMSALSKMLAELMPPELMQKLSELASSLENDPKRLAEAVKNSGELSADMKNQLEQALGVLERFMQEQKLSELSEKAQELARMEENLIKDADKFAPDEAAQRQKEIEQGLDELAKEASDLAAQIEDSDLAQELRELANQMAGENKELSQLSEKSLRQGKMDKSSARKLEKNLSEAAMRFSGLATNLQRNRQDEINAEMAKLTRELLLLSEEQENVLSQVGEKDNLELAARVTELERALERNKEDLFKLASQSFKVPRDAMHSLASASRNQAEFKQSLIDGRSGTASEQGRLTQHSIDQAAASLLSAYAQNCCGQGSSTGLEQLMQSLSSMSLAQLSINQKMGGLLPLPISTSMSEAQRQALSELMAEQGALRQQMEELAKSAGMEPGLAGMLEGIIEEMKNLEEDMAKYTGERELVERGEHVFRRMLDARNVLRKKDETREREREVGTVWEGLASPAMPQDAGERRLWLKQELVRFLRSDYPEEYKRMARIYLEALLEQE